MAMQKLGEKPARSGEYLEVGPRGGRVPASCRVSIEKGDTPLPPTQKPGRKWIKVGPVKPTLKVDGFPEFWECSGRCLLFRSEIFFVS